MLATTTAEVPNDYDLLKEGAEWLTNFLQKLLNEATEIAHPIIEIIRLAILDLKNDLVQLFALCSQSSVVIAEEIAGRTLSDEVLDFISKLSTSKSEHQKLSVITSVVEQDFFSGNTDVQKDFYGYLAILQAVLNEMTVFSLMSGMEAAPGSRHAGTNPTYHTARVVCEWLKTAHTRFSQDSSGEQQKQFRAELVAAIAHDFGKVFNPKSDVHHKLSLQLAGPGIKTVGKELGFSREIPLTNFLVHNHDICGHIAARRRDYQVVLAEFSKEPQIAEYMRSLFYLQLADMQAISTMPQAHKNENISIWAMLCTDLNLENLVDEMANKHPHMADYLHRRISFFEF